MNLKSKIRKIASAFTAAVMCMTMLPNVPSLNTADAASVGQKLSVGNGQNQHKGVCDNFSYEVWLDTTGGSGSMTLGSGATFKAEWSASVPSGNFLARRGLDFGSTKKATDYDYIGLDYEADYRQTGSNSGNSRLCVYGWFQNKGAAGNVPLVEYYIIEDWVDWCPDGNGKMVTIDGAQYKIFKNSHSGPSINSGYETFEQYFSVRQDKRKSGHITVSDHFKAWANEGWGIGNLYEVALNAEGWQSSGYADITKLNVYTDPNNSDITIPGTTPQEPEQPADGTYYFNDTFESGNGDWESRGATSLKSDSSNYYSGSKSLLVTGREDTWQGVAIPLDSSQFVPGYSYSFSTAVLQKSGSTEEAKLTLQYNDSSGTECYDTVASADAASGKWTKLENTSFTIPSGATNLLLYVETESTTDFYVDNAIGAVEGTKSTVTTGGGTVSGGTTSGEPSTTPTPSGDSLVGKFGSLFKMGTSVSPNELNSSAGREFILKHFNSITPENALKPEAIIDQSACQQRGNNVNTQINLNQAASTLKFCEDNNIGVRGHTFVWYSQTPDWFFKENFSSSGAYVSKEVMNQRLESMIKNTFEAIKTQYPNLNLYAYDVCNELFLNDGGGLREPGGPPGSHWAAVYGANNDEFIINAFTYARKYAPAGCKLYINDYNEYIPAKTNDIYNIAMKLKELGVIDGIGMQSHLDVGYPSASLYETALKKFLSTGLEVSITELDITESSQNSQAQADLFKAIFEMAVENADQIPSFTVWGTNDSISWRGSQTPLLFSSGYNPKKAYDAVMSIDVSSAPIVTTTTTTKPKTTTTTTSRPVESADWGDANCDGTVNLSDAILVMQALGNPDVYGENGSDKSHITAQGVANADVNLSGNGLTNADALAIQKYLLKLIDKLPESTQSGSSTTTTTTIANVNYFADSFSAGTDDWTERGSASLSLDTETFYSSGSSLKVTGREDTWQGAAKALDSSYKAGSTHSFSAAVLQATGSSQPVKMTLQYVLDGEEQYDTIAEATAADKKWTKLENTAYTIPEGATELLVYVELTDSTGDYYLDDFQAAAKGTSSKVTTGSGTVGDISAPVVTPSTGKVDPTKPMIAISFDDGTNPYGKRIINALAEQDFRATFFYVGNWIKDEDQIRDAYAKGMEIANHTTSHPYLTQKSASEIRSEYDQCAAKLKSIIGAEPSKLLRLPYLAYNSTVQSTLSDAPLITCAIDTEDWNGASKDQIVNKVKQAMSNGSANGAIILCHETYESTAAAIEELAPYIKAQGWQVVTISEMFEAKGQTLKGGQVYTRCN